MEGQGLLFHFYKAATNSNRYQSSYGISGNKKDLTQVMAKVVIDKAIKASSIDTLRPEIMSAIIDKFYSFVDIQALSYELAHALTMWDSDTCLKSAPSVIQDYLVTQEGCANRVLPFTDDVAFAIDDMTPKEFGILLNLISQGEIVCKNQLYVHRILSYVQRHHRLRDTSILAMMDLCIN